VANPDSGALGAAGPATPGPRVRSGAPDRPGRSAGPA